MAVRVCRFGRVDETEEITPIRSPLGIMLQNASWAADVDSGVEPDLEDKTQITPWSHF